MGTEVLRPHDLLAERSWNQHPTPFHRWRNLPANGNLTNSIVNKHPYNNLGHNRKTSLRPDKKQVEAKKPREKARRKDDVTPAIGHVTLLRRGESLDSLTSKIKGVNHKPKGLKSPNQKPAADDLSVCGIRKIGPDFLPKHIRVASPPMSDMYAGSAFSMSPSPRSLPLPSFFNKQSNGTPLDDPATRYLRRLLRLE